MRDWESFGYFIVRFLVFFREMGILFLLVGFFLFIIGGSEASVGRVVVM